MKSKCRHRAGCASTKYSKCATSRRPFQPDLSCPLASPAGHFDVFDIGYPVALPSREASLRPFAIEARRRTAKERLIDTFERVDTDHRVETVVDSTGDDGHYAAPGADVELRSSSAECVFGYQGGLFDDYLESAAWIGGPHAAVLDTKRAGAGANRDFGGLRLPGEREGDVPAVAFTVDQHGAVSVVAAQQRGWDSARPVQLVSTPLHLLALLDDPHASPIAFLSSAVRCLYAASKQSAASVATPHV